MVSAAFFHDHKFYHYDNEYYASSLSESVWKKRYLRYFDRLVVTGRLIESDKEAVRKSKSSTAGVEFNCIEQTGTTAGLLLNSSYMKQVIRTSLEQVDCAIIRLPSFVGDIALKECERRGVPYLVEMVSCPWDAFTNRGVQGKLIAALETWKTKRNVRHAPFVEYVTERFLQKRYPTDGKAIACSDVELPPTNNCVIDERVNRVDSWSPDKLKLGTIGALDVQYKGQDRVMRAIAIHRKSSNQAKWEYELVGGGSAHRIEAISKRLNVSDDVSVIGQLTHDQVIEWLDSLDVYIQPSFQEGLPRAVVEAMSRGLLVIGTDVGGIPELIEEEYLVKSGPNAPEEVCRIIEQLDYFKMRTAAFRNFQRSLDYSSDLLELKHGAFMSDFVGYVIAEGQNG